MFKRGLLYVQHFSLGNQIEHLYVFCLQSSYFGLRYQLTGMNSVENFFMVNSMTGAVIITRSLTLDATRATNYKVSALHIIQVACVML